MLKTVRLEHLGYVADVELTTLPDRRIRFDDLLAFKEADDKRRNALLDELAQDAQLHGHGY